MRCCEAWKLEQKPALLGRSSSTSRNLGFLLSVLGHPVVTSIAGRLQRTPVNVALRLGLQMGQSVLPKSTDEARIKENIDIFGWSIPEELMAEFSEIEQVKLHRAEFGVNPMNGYKTLEDLWDGEI